MTNYKYFIAKTIKGQEFMYSADSMTFVPTSSRKQFVDAFNAAGYQLKNNEVWHLYENDCITDRRIYKTATQRNGKITIRKLWRAI